MKTFPKPLTADEEKLYLQKYKEGDLEAKQILIEHNLRLVAHVAKKYQGLDEDQDDLISIGTIGLIKAVSTFDNSKGNRLATYAARCIDKALPSQRLKLILAGKTTVLFQKTGLCGRKSAKIRLSLPDGTLRIMSMLLFS